MSDGLRTYTKALYGFDATMVRAGADSWSNASPCDGWAAADVVAHTIGMNDMIAGFTRGVDAAGPSHDLPDDPLAAWRTSFDGLLEALDTKGALQVTARTPWGKLSVDRFLGFSWVDPLIHTWDLAQATGQQPALDTELAARAAAQLTKAGDSIRGERTFGPAVDATDDASAIERLIAVSGRRPLA